jgi:hypothetical protein
MNSRLLLVVGAHVGTAALGYPCVLMRLTGRYDPMQCGLQLIWLESERPRLALVSHSTAAIDEIDSIRPRGVSRLGGIPKLVQQGWHLNPKFSDTRSCQRSPFVFTARTGKDDVVFEVVLRLPDVARMGLGDVDHQKAHPVSEILVKLVEGGNLPPERRSGITAEDEHDRLPLRR